MDHTDNDNMTEGAVQGEEPSESQGQDAPAVEAEPAEGAVLAPAAEPQPSGAETVTSEESVPDKAPPVESEEEPKGEGESPSTLEGLNTLLESLKDPEVKLGMVIDFLASAIAQEGSPNFRNFWEARKHCIPLFKENISPAVRSALWSRYRELTDETRRLKEVLDEQSAFAEEQIGIAIDALEADLEKLSHHLGRGKEVPKITAEALQGNLAFYRDHQQRLTYYNAYASRINALRKELIKTEMRIRHKNTFFKRLSALGDKVFPQRKELIKQVSDQFLEDVARFVARCPEEGAAGPDLFQYREGIKSLQAAAKQLTLNTHAFTHSRKKLSGCWDKVRELDRDRKKERVEKRAVWQQNAEEVTKKITAFSEEYAKDEMSLGEAKKQLDQIQAFMREVDLGRIEVKTLHEQLAEARRPIYERNKKLEEERQQQKKAEQEKRRQAIEAVRDRIEVLITSASSADVEQLEAGQAEVTVQIAALDAEPAERTRLEARLRPLADLVAEKREEQLLATGGERAEQLKALKEVLKLRRERRREVKEELEELRKATGTSGLDIERAMHYNEQVQQGKERLEGLNSSIVEIEQQISQLRG